jgi:hypothetical protein
MGSGDAATDIVAAGLDPAVYSSRQDQHMASLEHFEDRAQELRSTPMKTDLARDS